MRTGDVIVHRGDTLSGIAHRHHVSLGALERANQQIANPDLIRPGQHIHLPGHHRHGHGHGHAEHGVAGLSPRGTHRGHHHAHAESQAHHSGHPASTSTNATSGASAAGSTGSTSLIPGRASLAAARIAEARATGHPSIGKCYAWVKDALQQGGAVNVHLDGVPAKGAGPELERHGFHNILNDPAAHIRSPYDAPVGSVLVYGPAPGATDRNVRWGHIEIRTEHGFASDYASGRARTGPPGNGLEGRGRVLIGVYVKPDGHGAARMPTTAGTTATQVGGVAASGLHAGRLQLSRQDIIDLKKTLQTEWVQSAGTDQAKGIVDTILNRQASGHWGRTIADVVNAPAQFSDINGRPAHNHGRHSVAEYPAANISARVDHFVDDYLRARASGTPSIIGSNLNYANPHYSDAVNLRWINRLDGPHLGRGDAIHYHGTTSDLQPYRPPAFQVRLP